MRRAHTPFSSGTLARNTRRWSATSPPPSLLRITKQGGHHHPFLAGSRRRAQKVRSFSFPIFHQRNEKRETSPRHVFCLFSTVRRAKPLSVFVFNGEEGFGPSRCVSVCSQRRGGPKPSSSCFLLVFNCEEGQNPPHRVFCSFPTVRRGTALAFFFFTRFNGEEGMALLVVLAICFQRRGGVNPSCI